MVVKSSIKVEQYFGPKEYTIDYNTSEFGKGKIHLFESRKVSLFEILRNKVGGIFKNNKLNIFKESQKIKSKDIIFEMRKIDFVYANSKSFDANTYFQSIYKNADPRALDADRTLEMMRNSEIDWINDEFVFAKVAEKFNFKSLTSHQRLALKPLLNKELNTLAREICKSEDFKDRVEGIEHGARFENILKQLEKGLMIDISTELADHLSDYFDQAKVDALVEHATSTVVKESYDDLSFDDQVKEAEIDDLIAQKPGSKSENSPNDIGAWLT